jgi:hypothetical protein
MNDARRTTNESVGGRLVAAGAVGEALGAGADAAGDVEAAVEGGGVDVAGAEVRAARGTVAVVVPSSPPRVSR